MYGGWLNAIRALSPPADTSSTAATKLPPVASTEAWARRLLQTQLASWADRVVFLGCGRVMGEGTHAELLARHLGAEIIAEENHGA